MNNTHQSALIGRESELTFLSRLFDDRGPDVIGVYGIAGIGKSTVINTFCSTAVTINQQIVHIDCQLTEPTAAAFLQQLNRQLDISCVDLTTLAGYFKDNPSLLVLDQFESFRLLETWFRRSFLPAMSGHIKLLFCGRLHPDKQWIFSPNTHYLYNSLKICSLSTNSAMQYLQSVGLAPQIASQACQFANGHPLALRLAHAAFVEQPGRSLQHIPLDDVIQTLADYFLEDIKSPQLKQAIEATACVRRISETILAGMLHLDDASELYRQLSRVDFIEHRADGLSLHELLKTALSNSLKARSPNRISTYKTAAWQVLKEEIKTSTSKQLWRYSADIIYLVENWVIRDAFFPPQDNREYSLESARAEDFEQVMHIVKKYEPSALHPSYEKWWHCAADIFHCVKNQANIIVGFYCLIDPKKVSRELIEADPVTRYWWHHLQQKNIDKQQPEAIFIRRWLSLQDGESRSGVQAACWIDIKRAYISRRPALHQVYMILQDVQPYASTAQGLGFAVLDEIVTIEEINYTSAFLNFGKASVDGWISNTLMKELEQSCHTLQWFDKASRSLIIDQQRVDLTQLEFGTLALLTDSPGVVISRTDILDKVWDIHYDGASNVVDTTLVGLRKKLGTKAKLIETARGVGYKFVAESGS